MVREVEYEKLGVAAALPALYTVTGGLAAWAVAAAVAALMAALCAAETDSVRDAVSRRRARAPAED